MGLRFDPIADAKYGAAGSVRYSLLMFCPPMPTVAMTVPLPAVYAEVLWSDTQDAL